jgi:signal transduction histidine kinase
MEQNPQDQIPALNSRIDILSNGMRYLKQELEKAQVKLAAQNGQMDALAEAVVRISLYHDSIREVVEQSVKMLHQGERDQLFRLALSTAMELAQAGFGILAVLNDDRELERLVAVDLPAEIEQALQQYPQDKHLTVEFHQLAEHYCASHISDESGTVVPMAGAQPRHNILEVPLPLGSGVIRAVISLACKQTAEGFNDHDILILEMFASEIAHLLEREELMGALRQRNRELDIEKVAQSVLIGKLQDAQAQLLQAEKMGAVGQLAAGIAHEINNPIGFVHSNLGSLEKYLQNVFSALVVYDEAETSLAGNEPALEIIRAWKKKADIEYLKEDMQALITESRDGVGRVKKIIQDLKEFSRLDQSDEWQLIDLNQNLDKTLSVALNGIDDRIQTRKEYGSVPETECLPQQLNQVFMNILINAVQAMPDAGIITARTGTKDGEAWVEIADTGDGISADILPRIFEPFFTTRPVGKGVGLGLSVAYALIQKHCGRIEVDSQTGKGAAFRVTLPLKRA